MMLQITFRIIVHITPNAFGECSSASKSSRHWTEEKKSNLYFVRPNKKRKEARLHNGQSLGNELAEKGRFQTFFFLFHPPITLKYQQ